MRSSESRRKIGGVPIIRKSPGAFCQDIFRICLSKAMDVHGKMGKKREKKEKERILEGMGTSFSVPSVG